MDDQGLYSALVRRGMTRRSFLKFSSAMAAALALPVTYAPRIAEAVGAAERLPVIWVRGQTCGGNPEGFLRASEPSITTLLLETLSVEYHESLLATAGAGAELTRTEAMARYPKGYVAIIEGAIPEGAAGAYCLIGGRPAKDVVREVCAGALATIAVGSCAFDGGIASANGALTDAKGIRGLTGDAPLITLPGCPMNVVNLVSVIVHYLTFREWPPLDQMNRPLSSYGNLIHNQCERRPHFEFGEFALSWGDEGAQRGWCLYKVGCKGPEAMGNCPTARYGEGVSWNIRAGHGCVGCVMPDFWDQMGPAYKRLPAPIPFLPNISTDMVGAAMVGGIGAVAGAHAVGMGIRFKRRARVARRAALAAAEGVAVAEAVEVLPLDEEPAGPTGAVLAETAEPETAEPETAKPEAPAPEAAPDPATTEGDAPAGTEER